VPFGLPPQMALLAECYPSVANNSSSTMSGGGGGAAAAARRVSVIWDVLSRPPPVPAAISDRNLSVRIGHELSGQVPRPTSL